MRICLYVRACADVRAHTDAYMMHAYIGGRQRTTCRVWFLPSLWGAGTALRSQGLAEAFPPRQAISVSFSCPSHYNCSFLPWDPVFLPSLYSWETSHFAASRLAKCVFPVFPAPSSIAGLPVTGVCAPSSLLTTVLPVAFRAPSCFFCWCVEEWGVGQAIT